MKIILEAIDNVSAKVDKIQEKLENTNKKITKSNQGVTDSIKEQVKPLNDVIRTVMRMGFIWGATIGVIIKLVTDLNKEITNLDKLSIKTGISTSDLSNRFYGFNIATEKSRAGTEAFGNFLFRVQKAALFAKVGLSEFIGEQEIMEKQYGVMGAMIKNTSPLVGMFLTPKVSKEDAIAQIHKEHQAKMAASREGQAAIAMEEDLYNKLTMSKVEYAREQFQQQVDLLKMYKVDTTALEEEYTIEETQSRNRLIMDSMAERMRLEGDLTGALRVEQAMQLQNFKKLTDDEIAIKQFQMTQEAKMAALRSELSKKARTAIISDLGALSTAMSAYAGENVKMAKAAAALSIGMAIINTAVAVTDRLANKDNYPWPVVAALVAFVSALGAIQVATIAQQSFAEGGRPPIGVPSLVGERGPELFVPDAGGTIIPNNRLGGYMGNQTSINIEILYPVVRSDDDIDALTEEISMRLARETERLF